MSPDTVQILDGEGNIIAKILLFESGPVVLGEINMVKEVIASVAKVD